MSTGIDDTDLTSAAVPPVIPRIELMSAIPVLDSSTVAAVPLIVPAEYSQTSPAWKAKRAFDVAAALLLLLLLAPLLLLVAIGTKISSRGPVLFRQSRVGHLGTVFTMYKFRTFPVNHVDDTFSLEHHECPLAFGRFLRRTSIDELPQLFNVVRGDMSIVGPRPERSHFVTPLSRTIPGYDARHRVRGGITGAAQVAGLWGNTSVEERVRHDNQYIDGWSLKTDAVILLRTIPALFRKGRTG